MRLVYSNITEKRTRKMLLSTVFWLQSRLLGSSKVKILTYILTSKCFVSKFYWLE